MLQLINWIKIINYTKILKDKSFYQLLSKNWTEHIILFTSFLSYEQN